MRRRDLIRAGLVVLFIAALLALLFFGIGRWENSRYSIAESGGTGAEPLKEITVNGKTYRQRAGVKTYLLLLSDAEQNGTCAVLVVNSLEKTWQLLRLSAEELPEYSADGVPTNEALNQISALLEGKVLDGWMAFDRDASDALSALDSDTDLSAALQAAETVKDHIQTDLSVSSAIKLGKTLKQYTQLETLNFDADTQSLQETILTLLYEEA